MVVASHSLFSFLCCLLFIIVSQASAQPSFLYYYCGSDNNTANSTIYHTNLNTLFSNLTSNTEIKYSFYNSSHGQNTDKVNALGLCRGDVKPDDCRSCLNDSRVLLTQLCPNQKEAIGWYKYDNCMLCYSNRSMFGIVQTFPKFYMWKPYNATVLAEFNQALRSLMDKLRTTATVGDYPRKYAAANVSGPAFQNIYGLEQCTPDLSSL